MTEDELTRMGYLGTMQALEFLRNLTAAESLELAELCRRHTAEVLGKGATTAEQIKRLTSSASGEIDALSQDDKT